MGDGASAVVELLRREKQRRDARALVLRTAVESAFETAPGPTFCVRRLDVVEHVARVLGIRVINNQLFADVERVATSLGWVPVKNGNRSLFRGAKRRDFDTEEALAVSRGNRFDARAGRPQA